MHIISLIFSSKEQKENKGNCMRTPSMKAGKQQTDSMIERTRHVSNKYNQERADKHQVTKFRTKVTNTIESTVIPFIPKMKYFYTYDRV